ncbi:helix-turn-helix domain-containing protein [Anaerostipes sp. AF04-45]
MCGRIAVGWNFNSPPDKKSPTLDQLEKIAKALNVRITDLFISKYK